MQALNPKTQHSTTAEIRLLQAAWRWAMFVALLGLLGGGLGIAWSESSKSVFKARAEILVRYGYEYTPHNANSGNDSMQVRIDADLALNSEVQVLVSPPVVMAALSEAPYRVATQDQGETPQLGFEEIAWKISVARLEGTNIISVAVVDRDGDWAQHFTAALIDAYVARREDLFSSDEQMQFLLAKKAELQKLLQDIDAKSAAASSLLRAVGDGGTDDIFRLWATAGVNLIEAAGRVGKAPDSLPSDTRATLPVDPQISLLGRLLEEFLAKAASSSQDASTPTAVSPALEEDPLKAVTGKTAQINATRHEAADLERQRQNALQSVSRVEELIQGIEFRRVLDQRIKILTPPYLLSSPVGIPNVQKIALFGAVGLLLGLFLAVVLEGSRAVRLRRA